MNLDQDVFVSIDELKLRIKETSLSRKSEKINQQIDRLFTVLHPVCLVLSDIHLSMSFRDVDHILSCSVIQSSSKQT